MSRYRKLIAALCGAAGVALSEGLVPAPENRYVSVGLALAAAYGVYQARNEPSATEEGLP